MSSDNNNNSNPSPDNTVKHGTEVKGWTWPWAAAVRAVKDGLVVNDRRK